MRRKGDVWNHFSIEESNKVNNTHPHVRCKYCPQSYERGYSGRMQAHLNNNCPNAPDGAKSQSKQAFEISKLSSTDEPSTTIQTYIPVEKLSKRLRTTKIDGFVDCISKKEQDDLEILLAQALIAAEVPLSFVENEYVIRFFQHLRPEFKLPNRKKLSDESLDVFEKVISESAHNNNLQSFIAQEYVAKNLESGQWIINNINDRVEDDGLEIGVNSMDPLNSESVHDNILPVFINPYFEDENTHNSRSQSSINLYSDTENSESGQNFAGKEFGNLFMDHSKDNDLIYDFGSKLVIDSSSAHIDLLVNEKYRPTFPPNINVKELVMKYKNDKKPIDKIIRGDGFFLYQAYLIEHLEILGVKIPQQQLLSLANILWKSEPNEVKKHYKDLIVKSAHGYIKLLAQKYRPGFPPKIEVEEYVKENGDNKKIKDISKMSQGNSFFIYRKYLVKHLETLGEKIPQQQLSSLASILWKSEADAVVKHYKDLSKQIKKMHIDNLNNLLSKRNRSDDEIFSNDERQSSREITDTIRKSGGNGFMIYRAELKKNVEKERNISMQELSSMASVQWRNEPEHVKLKFKNLANQRRKEHNKRLEKVFNREIVL